MPTPRYTTMKVIVKISDMGLGCSPHKAGEYASEYNIQFIQKLRSLHIKWRPRVRRVPSQTLHQQARLYRFRLCDVHETKSNKYTCLLHAAHTTMQYLTSLFSYIRMPPSIHRRSGCKAHRGHKCIILVIAVVVN